jgi:peptidoglycan L-alanyl-D-glutamate endopeptidase CwlK
MSYQLLKADVLFYQRLLKAAGFYKKKLDGVWGSGTDAADAQFLEQSQAIAAQFGSFDSRSESNIITLLPKAQALARQFLTLLMATGKDIRIISGTRTYSEQNAIYRQGRYGNKQPKVTNARGGQSNHNFGLAWDIGIFEGGKYITANGKYIALSSLVLPQLPGLEWGGNWQSFKDYPHYQLKAVSDSVTQIRNLFEKGTPYA